MWVPLFIDILPLSALLLVGVGVLVVLFFMKSSRAREILAKDYPDSPASKALAESPALDFIGHLNIGNDYLSEYDFDRALAHFQEALKLRNNDYSIHFKIGRIYLQKEDYKNAAIAFNNVITLNPQHIEAHYEVARLFMAQKKYEDAHKALNQALALNPEHEEVLRLKIKAFEHQEAFESVLPLLKKLIEKSTTPRALELQYAETLFSLARYDEVLAEYQLLVAKYPDDRIMFQAKMGQAYFEMGQFSQAVECFRLVLTTEDALSHEPVLLSQMAAALCNEGVKFYQAGDFTIAIQYYLEATRYDDKNADIHFNLGKAYGKQGDAESAMRHLSKAVELNPNDVMCYYELAALQDQQGLDTEAIASYHHVLTLYPKHAQAYFGLGSLYGFQGNMDNAIKYLSEAVKIDPTFEDAIYNLGVALERQKQFTKAMAMYKKVLTLNQSHEQAKSNLYHLQTMKK